MKFIDVLKAIVTIIVDVGTGVVVGHYTGDAVKNAKGASKVCATIAASAISGFVASKAAGYLNDQIDEISESVSEFSNKMNQQNNEEEE